MKTILGVIAAILAFLLFWGIWATGWSIMFWISDTFGSGVYFFILFAIAVLLYGHFQNFKASQSREFELNEMDITSNSEIRKEDRKAIRFPLESDIQLAKDQARLLGFIISFDGGIPISIKHLHCGRVNYNSGDIEHPYCAFCGIDLERQSVSFVYPREFWPRNA